MSHVAPPVSVTFTTSIVLPATVTGESPHVAFVPPGLNPFGSGVVQPAGITIVISPWNSDPAAAVYVKVRKVPVEAGATVVGNTVSVPVPSADTTVTIGETPRAVSVPPADDFSCVVNVLEPPVPGALAPGPPEPVSPKTMWQLAALARLIP